MIVTRSSFNTVVTHLKGYNYQALDTETFGLRMYHGDLLFSIICSVDGEDYYFNFKVYEGETTDEEVLPREFMATMQKEIFDDEERVYFIQNAANFDLCVLAQDQIDIKGTIHCTKAVGRVEYNQHQSYSLHDQLTRIGEAKDDAVMKYIKEHKLYTKVSIPGKAQRVDLLHFDRVPFKTIVPYGKMDGHGTLLLGKSQIISIRKQDDEQPKLKETGRTLEAVMHNERRLQKTIFRMKHVGVRIDKQYCERAIRYENDREQKAGVSFKRETGQEYQASPKLFAELFAGEKENWSYTEKGNPSFDADAIAKLKHPAAKLIVEMRDAKAKADFYQGFLYHADSKGDIHPNYNPEGTVHGRFSSSEPNFQNLTAEDDEETLAGEFVVRRAIIPRPGYVFIMPDYDQMEYKFMLEQALKLMGEMTPLGQMVVDGFDFHDATTKNVKEKTHIDIVRKDAKIANFLTLYGGGINRLAEALGSTYDQAAEIRYAIFQAAPEIKTYISEIMKTAEQRGYIVNWLGRRCHFPNPQLAYKAPNYHTSGGCADVVKVAMNRIDEALLGLRSRMVMSVHDELPIEIHEDELIIAPQIVKDIMDRAYISKYIPLTTGMEYSAKSLGDKVKGFPV